MYMKQNHGTVIHGIPITELEMRNIVDTKVIEEFEVHILLGAENYTCDKVKVHHSTATQERNPL